MEKMILLGDEAVALGAIHGGISSAYGYPGTPSTEILEYILDYDETNQKIFAAWSANEKTAYEEALGASYAGKRVLVTMKHVGLNVAADAFVNSALLDINGGLVLAIADDPGMHSSQNEQDSRFYADFAHVPCLEPVNQQEAYEMTRQAFEISEKFHVPVMVRLVTRLSHSRAGVAVGDQLPQNSVNKAKDKKGWMLLPATARKNYHKLIGLQTELAAFSEKSHWNRLSLASGEDAPKTGYITTGLGKNYFLENIGHLGGIDNVNHLHIGCYPPPKNKIRELAEKVEKLIIIEEGYPVLETQLRGILPLNIEVAGKLDNTLPMEGELNPDNVRPAMGLEPIGSYTAPELPMRPPQLCKGCPHEDSFSFIKQIQNEVDESIVTADIGCYALGALPPYAVPETIVCMGASITLAKGAAEAGHKNVAAVIGDSTFYHSGLTGLVDCVSTNTPITIVILDNSTVGMTGGQETILPSTQMEKAILGLGVKPEHVHVLRAHPKDAEKNEGVFRNELAYQGTSVIIAVRECLEWFRKLRKKGKSA